MKILPCKMWIALCALGTLLGSCDSLIYDDLKNCPQGVYVRFYAKTPCDTDTTFIGKVPSLTVFAFDKNDKLVTSVTESQTTLSREKEVLLPVSNGAFSFISWAGTDDHFTTGSFVNGTTTKQDVMLTLKSTSGVAENLSNTKLWQGESPVVSLPDPEVSGSVYQHTSIRLHEITNRITVKVELDSTVLQEGVTPRDLTTAITSANGTVNIDGSMPLDGNVLKYPAVDSLYTDRSVSWDYALMELKTGYHNTLTLSYPAKNQTLFSGDLIGSILLLYEEQTNINMDCQNDFVIKFVVKDYCEACQTHFSCDIYVNNWRVHSYETNLGI